MNRALLQSDGVLVPDTETGSGNPLAYLNHGIVLAPGCTLRSYFRLMERYPVFQELNAFLPGLVAQYGKGPEPGGMEAEPAHLEFSKTVEMIGFPGTPRLEIYTAFKGVSGEKRLEIRSIRIERLLDMPLKLGRLKHILFGDKMELFEFETVYTLFEFIDGIAWALSFHGTPTECQIRR